MNGAALSIAAVERDTGLSKDLLRVWERRYGFPKPLRDAAGERAYDADQVARLRVVKRLIDAGYRPGRVLQLGVAELQSLALAAGRADDRQQRASGSPALADGARLALLDVLRGHDLGTLQALLQQQLHALGPDGLDDFVLQRAPALNAAVAEAGLAGQLQAFEERAYQQALLALLRDAMADLAGTRLAPGAARVLLATLPGEPHSVGLALAEALLALRGCHCIVLGSQLAPGDLARAAQAYAADIAVLPFGGVGAFGGSLGANAVVAGLTELREQLPVAVAVWAHGAVPVLKRRRVPGVLAVPALADLPAALARWRTDTPVAAVPALQPSAVEKSAA